jgi:hypothetical protein
MTATRPPTKPPSRKWVFFSNCVDTAIAGSTAFLFIWFATTLNSAAVKGLFVAIPSLAAWSFIRHEPHD